MRLREKRSAILLLLVLGMPAAASAALVFHELEHAGDEGHGHLAAVLHGHDHGFDVEDHQHPLVRSSVPVASVPRHVAWHNQVGLFIDTGWATTLQISSSRPPPSLSSSDLCTWLL